MAKVVPASPYLVDATPLAVFDWDPESTHPGHEYRRDFAAHADGQIQNLPHELWFSFIVH